jgi:hypothetical protein
MYVMARLISNKLFVIHDVSTEDGIEAGQAHRYLSCSFLKVTSPLKLRCI